MNRLENKMLNIAIVTILIVICWAIGADQHNQDVKNQERAFALEYQKQLEK